MADFPTFVRAAVKGFRRKVNTGVKRSKFTSGLAAEYRLKTRDLIADTFSCILTESEYTNLKTWIEESIVYTGFFNYTPVNSSGAVRARLRGGKMDSEQPINSAANYWQIKLTIEYYLTPTEAESPPEGEIPPDWYDSGAFPGLTVSPLGYYFDRPTSYGQVAALQVSYENHLGGIDIIPSLQPIPRALYANESGTNLPSGGYSITSNEDRNPPLAYIFSRFDVTSYSHNPLTVNSTLLIFFTINSCTIPRQVPSAAFPYQGRIDFCRVGNNAGTELSTVSITDVNNEFVISNSTFGLGTFTWGHNASYPQIFKIAIKRVSENFWDIDFHHSHLTSLHQNTGLLPSSSRWLSFALGQNTLEFLSPSVRDTPVEISNIFIGTVNGIVDLPLTLTEATSTNIYDLMEYR